MFDRRLSGKSPASHQAAGEDAAGAVAAIVAMYKDGSSLLFHSAYEVKDRGNNFQKAAAVKLGVEQDHGTIEWQMSDVQVLEHLRFHAEAVERYHGADPSRVEICRIPRCTFRSAPPTEHTVFYPVHFAHGSL
jgi:hypothetical protein